MNTHLISCPYCGEGLEVAVDRSVRRQEYVDDCQGCCRPMVLAVTVDLDDPNDIQIDVHGEDD